MKFPHQYDRLSVAREKRSAFKTAVGSGIIPTYTPHLEKDGTLTLVQDGEHNLYEEIQSHKDSTDLQLIINRYMNGDPTVLARVQGVYGDFSQMPQSMHEAYDLMRKAELDFKKLPAEIQASFDNDPTKFIMSLGSDEWLEKMQISKPADPIAPVAKESEVVQNG
nr:MAG TPA: Scaffold protein [Microviridae sp.]